MPLTSGGADVTGGAGRRPALTLAAVLSAPLVWAIRLYQRFISPLSPQSCRFHPSCSSYAVEALQRFGPIKGSWLAARRVGRCHPWNAGGVDPVPQTWADRHLRPEDWRPPVEREPGVTSVAGAPTEPDHPA